MSTHHDVAWVHVDDACIVIGKPSGLLSVPGRFEAPAHCASAQVQARHADARVVHRLDMSTSGLMLFARGAPAQRRLNDAFARRAVHKRYAAVVHGAPAHAQGVIELPLRADWPNRPRQRIDLEHGRPCTTHYRVTARDGHAHTARMELRPLTGRSHQLRVHLQALGHPILGDALYAPLHIQAQAMRLLLHADQLGFDHPATGQALCFDLPAPF